MNIGKKKFTGWTCLKSKYVDFRCQSRFICGHLVFFMIRI